MMINIRKQFSKQVTENLKKLDIKPTPFAKNLKLSAQHLRKVLKGSENISLDNCQEIIVALNNVAKEKNVNLGNDYFFNIDNDTKEKLSISDKEFEFEKTRLKNIIHPSLQKLKLKQDKQTEPEAICLSKRELLLEWSVFFDSDFFNINKNFSPEKVAEEYIKEHLNISGYRLNEILLWVKDNFFNLALFDSYKWLTATRFIAKHMSMDNWDETTEKTLYYEFLIRVPWAENYFKESKTSLENWYAYMYIGDMKDMLIDKNRLDLGCSDDELFWKIET